MELKIGQWEFKFDNEVWAVKFVVGDVNIEVGYSVTDPLFANSIKVFADGKKLVTIPLPVNQKGVNPDA